MKIKNLSDLRNADIKYKLEKIPTKEIIIKDVDNFWDGPLSGECMWRNKEYYYQCFDQVDPHTNEDLCPRKYLLLDLTVEQFVRYPFHTAKAAFDRGDLSTAKKYAEKASATLNQKRK